MPLVLVIGSHVAGSRVGGTVTSLALALSPAEVDPMHVPTTLLGRHPGWGPPGGGAVEAAVMAGMLEGIAANGLFALVDGVITNYFANSAQVEVAARAIDAVKAANPKAIILVDPVMGDAGRGLYIREDTAEAVARELVPRADIITPNIWELNRLTGFATDTIPHLIQAAKATGKMVLVTSVKTERGIGGLWLDPYAAFLGVHEKEPTAPKGTGDLLAAMLMARLIEGMAPSMAAASALAGVAHVVANATKWGAQELPIVGDREAWSALPLKLERVG